MENPNNSEVLEVLDIFKGYESYWTSRLTGIGGIKTRGAYKRVESLTPEKEALRRERIASTWNSKSREELKEIGDSRHRVWLNMPLDEYLKRGEALSLSFKIRPESTKRRCSELNSLAQKNLWINITQEDYIKRGRAISQGLKNMPEEKKNKRLEDIGKSYSTYWKSLSPEAKQEHRNKIGLGQKRRLESLTEEERATRSRDLHITHETINIPENSLRAYLDKNFPGEWVYNGQGQADIILGGKIPDFVDLKTKRVIEILGTYWHNIKEVELKINHYKTYGWTCIVLWDYEVYLEEELDKFFNIKREVS